MLVLLIIFMVAAPLSTVDLPVELPTSTATPQKKPDKPTYVSIKPDLSVAIGENFVKRVDLVRTGVFGLGCAMAALGGVLAAPLVTAFLGMGTTVVIDAFVIVIIGGMGSFLGSLIGSILVAFVQVLGAYYFQDLALAFMYFLMLIVLVIRPGGLLGKED